jgi:hypothetical protein
VCLWQSKKTGKKGRPLKLFIHRSKLQASISDEILPPEAGACLRRLPLHPRCFSSANWPENTVVGLGRITAPINRDSLWPSWSEALACNLDWWMKNFDVRHFFSCFFIARANQKIRILALGGASTILKLYLIAKPSGLPGIRKSGVSGKQFLQF